MIREAAAARAARRRAAPARPAAPAGRRRQHDARRGRPPRDGLRGRLQEHLLLRGVRRLLRGARPAVRRRLRRGPLRGRRARAGRHERDPPGRPPRARHRRRPARAPSTATVESAGSTSASRQTYMVSGAVRDACRAALAEQRERGGGEVDVERIFRHIPTTPLDPETGQVTGERAHVALAVAAMKVVAEVDVELGLTRVVWIGAAQEIGHAIDPRSIEGQIEGGIAQGLGLAVMEEIQTRDGLITNASFTDYLIPTALDMPPVETRPDRGARPERPVRRQGRRRAARRRLDRGRRRRAARRDGPRAPARAGQARRARRPSNEPLLGLRSPTAAPAARRARRPTHDRRADQDPRGQVLVRGRARRAGSRRPGSRRRRSRRARAARSRAARCRPCSR